MRRGIVAIGLGFALVAVACGGDGDESNGGGGGGGTQGEQGPVPITVTMTSWIGYGLFHLADEKGFFDDHGVDLTIQVVEDESTNPAALESNDFQGDLTTVDTNVRTIAAGVDLVQVLVVDDSNGADGIVATADVQSVQDLAGKDVGVKVGATSYVFLLSVLKDAGMTIDDIHVVDMNPGEAGTAFVAGQIDAAVTWEPFLSRATKREGGHVVISSADAPGLIVDSLTIRRDWVDAHPDAVTGLIQGYYDAYDFWQSNPDEALPIMADSQGISTDDFKATLPGVTMYSPQEIVDFMNAPADETGVLKLTTYINEFWVDEGVIEAPIDPAKSIDGHFAQEALSAA
jgi:NitT/TauT family transport system substrate-binding protein